MTKTKKFLIPLSDKDLIDVRLTTDKKEVFGFVLNYWAKFEEAWYQIYRVDTSHGYLHEQRFWITPEPIPLPTVCRLFFEICFRFLSSTNKRELSTIQRVLSRKNGYEE